MKAILRSGGPCDITTAGVECPTLLQGILAVEDSVLFDGPVIRSRLSLEN